MLIDLSRPIENGMPVFPGDIDTTLVQRRALEKDHYCEYTLQTGLHAGTHADAPMHLVEDARFIAQLSPERFYGEGFLLWGMEDPSPIPPDRCVLIRTGAAALYGTAAYFSAHPEMDEALCARILAARPRCIGVDAPSPDRPPFRVHRAILRAGVPVIENLCNLDALRGRAFTFMALPLKLSAEASLVRAAALLPDNTP